MFSTVLWRSESGCRDDKPISRIPIFLSSIRSWRTTLVYIGRSETNLSTLNRKPFVKDPASIRFLGILSTPPANRGSLAKRISDCLLVLTE